MPIVQIACYAIMNCEMFRGASFANGRPAVSLNTAHDRMALCTALSKLKLLHVVLSQAMYRMVEVLSPWSPGKADIVLILPGHVLDQRSSLTDGQKFNFQKWTVLRIPIMMLP